MKFRTSPAIQLARALESSPVLTLANVKLPSIGIDPAALKLLTRPIIAPEILSAISNISRLVAPATAVVAAFSELDKKALEYRAKAHALGRCGWTIPMAISVPDLFDLLEGVEPGTDYDGAFEGLYLQDKAALYHEVVRDLRANKHLKQWHKLLAECDECYRAGHFLVVVPALLAVFEGAVAIVTGSVARKGDPKGLSAARRQKARVGIDLVAWASIEGFAAELFRNHAFRKSPPGRLNRHWALHGRGPADWTRADVLRLLQAIHTIA